MWSNNNRKRKVKFRWTGTLISYLVWDSRKVGQFINVKDYENETHQ